MGRNCRFLQGPDTDRDTIAILRDAIREGRACHVVLLNYKKDGITFWNELDISPVYGDHDPNGRLLYFVGVQNDVTERLRAIEARIAAEYTAAELATRLKSILGCMPVGFIILDKEWRFEYVNRHAEIILGRTEEALVGRNHWEEFPQPDGSIFWTNYHAAMEEQRVIDFETFSKALGIWLEIHLVPTADRLTILFQNVTESHQA